MFPPSSSSALPPPDPWAGSPRRSLRERIVETLRHLSEDVEARRVGGLGEAQAAGYVAGRFRRADYAATVQSFRAGVGDRPVWSVIAFLGAWGGGLVTLGVARATVGGGGLLLALALLFLALDLSGRGGLRMLLKGKLSQSVVAPRAARDRQVRWRVIVLAPLDGPPLMALGRNGTMFLIGALVVALSAAVGTLVSGATMWRVVAAACGGGLLGMGSWIALRPLMPAPVPAIHGAGELTTLLMIADELEPLQHVEVWLVALGGGSVGHESVHALMRHYPFSPSDTWVINLHHITAGQPVFVTREGVLRERRSASVLRGLASDTDAADLMIDAEPRRVRQRTLAQSLLRQQFRAITITSHSDATPFTSPNAGTIERCVRLVAGVIRGLDA